MPETYKKLHSNWKTAKKDAKLMYEAWDRMFTDVSNANVDVKYGAPRFPKFKEVLGPSLDKLEANKDVEKNKAKATKAVKQYNLEIRAFERAAGKMTPPATVKNGARIQQRLLEETLEMRKVLAAIAEKLLEK